MNKCKILQVKDNLNLVINIDVNYYYIQLFLVLQHFNSNFLVMFNWLQVYICIAGAAKIYLIYLIYLVVLQKLLAQASEWQWLLISWESFNSQVEVNQLRTYYTRLALPSLVIF